MDKKRETELSKTISYALRHRPEEFNIVLDSEGFTNINALIENIKKHSKKWLEVTLEDMKEIVEKDEKGRYEIKGDQIRAVYGHSVKGKIDKVTVTPPEILYHGTTPESAKKILEQGLKSMSRQYVHLSKDLDTAIMVAKRRTKTPVVLTVLSEKAYKDGFSFYYESNGIYLSDSIPGKYIIEGRE